jgi:hypothetical protein
VFLVLLLLLLLLLSLLIVVVVIVVVVVVTSATCVSVCQHENFKKSNVLLSTTICRTNGLYPRTN